MTPEATAVARGPGRPRDGDIDAAVKDVVMTLLDEAGPSALSIDGIAASACVSKASIYRRWESKEDLILDAVAAMAEQVELVSTGDLRTDLISVLTQLQTFLSTKRSGSVFPWLVGEIAAGSPIGRRYVESVVIPRRRALRSLIETAQSDGRIRDGIDVETAVDILTGPVLVRTILGQSGPDDAEWSASVADGLIDGWAP